MSDGFAKTNADRLPEELSGWLEAVLAIAAHYQLDASRERLGVAMAGAAVANCTTMCGMWRARRA